MILNTDFKNGNNKKANTTTVAYRCPHCGQAVLGPVGAFTVNSDLIKLKCQCGESEMLISKSGEDKIRLTLPCLVCPKPHSYLLSRDVFFSGQLFVIPCSYTGLDVAFMGNSDDVQASLEKQAKELNAILEENGLDSFSKLKEDERFDEQEYQQVEDIVRFMLCELDDEGKIHCYCKEDGEIPYYGFQILSERVRIYCECCNGSTEIPIGSVTDAEHFLSIDSLTLK